MVVVNVLSEGNHDLDPCLDEVKHSPTGFECGYAGSGPAQLAYAILRDYTGDVQISMEAYMGLKWAVIAGLPMDGNWVVTGDQVEKFLSPYEAEKQIPRTYEQVAA